MLDCVEISMLSGEHFRFLKSTKHLLKRSEGLLVRHAMSFGEVQHRPDLYAALEKANILSISPAGDSLKWTDYGLALYQETEALQQAWTETPVITLDDANKDQIVIRSGEPFRGKYFVLQVLKRATRQVSIQDNFCSHEILAWLYSVPSAVEVRVLTSKKNN